MAYLLTGGNLGNREENLQKACALIEERCGKIQSSSSIYETEAWGMRDQPAFFNQALALQTSLLPAELMRELLAIESEMGRTRTVKMGPRTIDIDILLIGDQVIHTDLLTLPHPAMASRRFVLLPLSEIAPALVHPVLHKTISVLLAECTDPLDVQKKSPAAN
ncbi:2-amino-4-hydroxy-6-hydroxymethyldihydropteridine diphosphokinase [Sediminibacterium soli]|uniref:2-amino-4-hydroxy-6- hydroxymethyldihydropteridine diphosphokinase n=1 Tax=Sediminibacterium soli TaxID=2698829 RepID=UPI001F35128D|nr:2-amino-4-hydroxy-6-hydroxymethyldihydropteridine diphosphokinase [Sediminibacterium soli]